MLTMLAAVAGSTGVALAGATSGSLSDPAGDVFGSPAGARANFDILGATFGGGTHGRAVQTLRVAGQFSDPAKGGLVPSLWIDVPKYPGARGECDYYIGRVDSRIALYLCGSKKRVGNASVVRTDANTLRYSFNQRLIGKPHRYKWAFFFHGPSQGGTVLYDRVSDTAKSDATYQLR
jgi:hypothetical protein